MLFKSAFIYRFTKPVPWPASELEEALQEYRFSPCAANDTFRLGWVAPAPVMSDELTYKTGRYVLITLNKEEKILPASVINDEVDKRAQVIEEKEQRKLRKKEKQELKELVMQVMLPKAFSKSKKTSAYLDMEQGLLIVDTPSQNKADEFTSFLRQSTGTLPIRFISLKEAAAVHFSNWVKTDTCPPPFTSGDQCELRADDGTDTIIRCKGTESLTDAISSHIDAGMQVTQIAMNWDDKISFLLADDIVVKRLKYLDTFQDQAAENGSEAAEKFASNFSLMTLEFEQMTTDIINALGGEDLSDRLGEL